MKKVLRLLLQSFKKEVRELVINLAVRILLVFLTRVRERLSAYIVYTPSGDYDEARSRYSRTTYMLIVRFIQEQTNSDDLKKFLEEWLTEKEFKDAFLK